MARLLTAAEIHQKRVTEGDFDPAQYPNGHVPIGADDPKRGGEFWKPAIPRYVTAQEQHEHQLRDKAKESARDADEGPTWAEQMELRRCSSYADWLEIVVEVNAKVAVSRAEIAKLDEDLSYALVSLKHAGRIQDKGPSYYADRIPQPLERDAVMALAKEVPHLEAAVPLLKTAIRHHEEVVDQLMQRLTAPWNGLLSRIHADLKQRIDECRALRISELRTKIHQDLREKLGEISVELLEQLTGDRLQKVEIPTVSLPEPNCLDIETWQTAIKEVQALTMPQESVVEAVALDNAAEVPNEINRTKRRSR